MNQINKRYDGFMNLMSGLGTPGLDRSVSTFQSNWGTGYGSNLSRFWQTRFSVYDLTALYISNGLAQKIVDRPSDDSFQRGVEIEGDEEENLMSNEWDRLGVLTKMADAVRWTRLYGGSVMLLIAKDGGELTDPLNLDTLDEILEIRVIDMTCVKGTQQYYDDPTDPLTYGKLEYYEIVTQNAPSFMVHETRIITVAGDPLPSGIVNYNQLHWAGRSVLEGCYADIARYMQGLDWSLRLLERKQQAVYKMTGLGDAFAQGDDDLVRRRIHLVDLVRSNLNSVAIDAQDEYNVTSASMEGVQTTLEEYQTALSASCSIPITILFGKSTRGLNQTGSGDLEAYYGLVGHTQTVIAKPALEKLTSILWCQKALRGKAPEDWKIKFNPLWLPTDLEVAQTDLAEQQANTGEVNSLIALMTNQILTPEEVRQIVVNKYDEYEFSDELPEFGDDVGYAQGVDETQMDVPDDTPQPKTSSTPTTKTTTSATKATITIG